MAHFGLIGHPISHSQSPALFEAAYGTEGDTYQLIETDSPEEALRRFRTEDFRGVNVTAPFKDIALASAGYPDRIAGLLGSTNLLLKTSRGIEAYNTDYFGVKGSFEEEILGNPSRWPERIRRAGTLRNALVVGAGGAGKAAALALCDSGLRVWLANRSSEKAEPFARSIGARYIPLEKIEEILPGTELLVYSLACSVPQIENADFSGHIVFEANYARPLFHPEGGISTGFYLSGKYWLYHQAVPAFRIFTQKSPNTLQMKKVIGIL